MNNKTKIARLQKNKSVIKIFEQEEGLFMGVKNTSCLKKTVEFMKMYDYKLHTIDSKSYLNRAIDFELINPLSGKYISGSSSGTALNVFLDINDIGIGTDGGGSVLGPAINLNLYAFISRNLPIKKVVKKSTDNIEFTVSAGLISKKIDSLQAIYHDICVSKETKYQLYYLKAEDDPQLDFINAQIIKLDKSMSRHELIDLCLELYHTGIIISHESKIDFYQIGDSIVKSMNDEKNDLHSKGLIRIINMCQADAFVIPTNVISSGFVISTTKFYTSLLELTEKFPVFENELIDRYFSSENYLDEDFEE